MKSAGALVLIAVLALGVLSAPAPAQDRAAAEREFRRWVSKVVIPKARASGVSRRTVERAFGGVTLDWDLPGLVFPGTAKSAPRRQTQAEFREPADYFNQRRLKGAAATGRKLAAQHGATLAAVERKTGVPGRIVLAIWARESGYGRVAIRRNAFRVLGTRAFAGGDDGVMRELVAALEIVEAGAVAPGDMKSSWAGALGQPQFMPTSYLAYGADGDGDGRADIWRSTPDTLASIANYLAKHGWQRGRDWGFEVEVPEGVSCALEGPDQGRMIRDWEKMGIRRVSGRPFPKAERRGEGFLMMPAGRHGPAFLVTANFLVLKDYNRSDLYALYVGNLGDRIQYGMGDFTARWDRLGEIHRSDIATIQRELEARGHDVGGADGLPGFKTRRSIGRWQEATGRPASCFPEPWMVGALAR